MKNLKVQGFIVLDVDVAALNNAGKSTSTQFDNGVATKKIRKGNESYVYVSGQAWRYWWRNTLEKSLNWEMSPITRDKNIAYTAANPIAYADDDVFGYMRAAKENITDKKGKTKSQNVTVTRVSPLKNSAIVSVAATSVATHWSSMARQEGDSVPYAKEEYSAIMKGMFSLDLEQVGTFANYNKTGFKNLTDTLAQTALEQDGTVELNDPYVKQANGEPQKLIRLNRTTRVQRAVETIKALKVLSGGAMQTNNLADVTPKLIVLSTMCSGNHPFSHVYRNNGAYKQIPELNVDGLKEVLEDYKEQFEGKVFIGVRNGFLDKEDYEKLEKLAKENEVVELFSVNKAIDAYCDTLNDIIS